MNDHVLLVKQPAISMLRLLAMDMSDVSSRDETRYAKHTRVCST